MTWPDMSETVTVGMTGHAAMHAELAKRINRTVINVESAADLAQFLVGDAYVLPANRLISLHGSIDLGNRYLQGSTGTVLRGYMDAAILSTTTGGVVRFNNVNSAVHLREFTVLCPNGPGLVLTGPITQQLNMFYVGMVGLEAARITGFDVQSVKSCFVQCDQGITFDGVTHKLFIHETPFFGITGSAILLKQDFSANVADIVTSFFRFNAPGVAIEAEPGYIVVEGLVRGSLIDGTATPTLGLGPSDPMWRFMANTGVRDSEIIAELHSTNNTLNTTFTGANTPTKIVTTTSTGELQERFTTDGAGSVTYTGWRPTTLTVQAVATLDPESNNVNARVYLALNDVPITASSASVFIGSGSDRRQVTLLDAIRVNPGDRICLYIANTSNATAIRVTDVTLLARG